MRNLSSLRRMASRLSSPERSRSRGASRTRSLRPDVSVLESRQLLTGPGVDPGGPGGVLVNVYTWVGPDGGLWSNPNNWQDPEGFVGTGVPGANAGAVINTDDITVVINANTSVGVLTSKGDLDIADGVVFTINPADLPSDSSITHATVSGDGSVVNTNTLNLTNSVLSTVFTNNGTVNITGTVTFDTATKTNAGGASINVLGNGGSGAASSLIVQANLDNEGTLTLGQTGALPAASSISVSGAYLTNDFGGSIVATNTTGARQISLTASAVLDNQGTIDIDAPLTIANSSTFLNTGTIDADANTTISGAFTNQGTTDVAVGTTFAASSGFVNQGTVNIAGKVDTSSYTQTAGETNLLGGVLDPPPVAVTAVSIEGGVLQGEGTVIGNLAVGTNPMFTGRIAPGGDGQVGTIDVTGDLRLGAWGKLDLELEGAGAGQFDTVDATGFVTVNGGDLLVSSLNGFNPALSDVFSVVSGASTTGAFDQVNAQVGAVNLFPTFLSDEILLSATQDVTSRVSVTYSGFSFVRSRQVFAQQLKLTNTGSTAISGPISVVIENLTAGVSLSNKTGTTSLFSPGNAYIDVPGVTNLAPGQSVTVLLEFSNPMFKFVSYSSRLLAGPGVR